MAKFKKLITEVGRLLYEKLDNDAKAFRYVPDMEERHIIMKKVRYLQKHLRDAQQHPKTEKEQLMCYGHLGTAFMKLEELQKARENYEIQLSMAEEFKDNAGMRMAHANIGVLDKMQWKLGAALERFNLSLDIALKTNNKWAQGRLYNNISHIHEMCMDFERAIEFQKQRLEIAEDLGDRDGYVKASASIAAMYHTIGDNHNAIRFIEQITDQLRKNLKILDTLADDASGSEDGGYINLGDEEGDEDGDDDDDGGGGGKKKRFKLFKKKKK